jgi:serine/threonine protein kinase
MKLSQQGYMHGDIHLGNIMFREKDCTLHLIDFDLLDTYDQFYEDHKTDFGFPKDPPECLFLHEIQRLPQIVIPLIVPLPRKNIVEEFKKTTKPLNEIKEKTAVVEYTESLYRLYPAVWSYTQRDRNRLFTNIQSAIIKNASYLTQLQQKNKQLDLRSYAILPYYDNYSIGLCLSEFLLTIYPFPANEGDEDEFLPFLKKYKQLPSKKESHIPFTNRTVYAIRETINLLLRMSHFELQKRPTPMDAYEKMKEILNEYQTEVQYFFSSSLQMTNRNHTRKNRS